jgi:hypothetical protein
VPLNCKDWKYKVPRDAIPARDMASARKAGIADAGRHGQRKIPGSVRVCITDNHICTPCKLNTEGFE